MPTDSPNSTLVVAATPGLQELQGCSDSGRQGPEQMDLVTHEAVSTLTKFSSGVAMAWAGSVCDTGCIMVAASPPLCLPVLSALWSYLLVIL